MMQLENSRCIAGLKSKSGQDLSVGAGFSELCQFQKVSDMRGITDHQVIAQAYSSEHYSGDLLVEEFILEDERALRGESFLIFETLFVHGEPTFLLVQKSPYIEHNKITASYFHAVMLPSQDLQLAKVYLNNSDIMVSGHTKQYLNVFELAPSRKYKLSQRELQCIRLLVQGLSAKIIAYELGLSRRTIEFYISNIKDKLGVSRATEIVALAVSEGLI